MKTIALENSARIMDYQLLENEEQKQNLINELLIPAQDIEEKFSEPFSKELNENLLEKESQDGIKIVIKHVISKFSRAELFFDNHKNILYKNNYIGNGSSEYCFTHSKMDNNLNEFENYVIVSYFIFNCHFYDIQNCCIKYQIDFFDICRELHFKWDLISTGITKSFRETEDLMHFNNNSEENFTYSVDQKKIKSLPELLLHENNYILAEKLKSEFNTEKGKSIRLIIEVLKNKHILKIGIRQGTNIYKALKEYFGRDIGSKQSIFNYEFNMTADKIELEGFEKRIDFLLKEIDNH